MFEVANDDAVTLLPCPFALVYQPPKVYPDLFGVHSVPQAVFWLLLIELGLQVVPPAELYVNL